MHTSPSSVDTSQNRKSYQMLDLEQMGGNQAFIRTCVTSEKVQNQVSTRAPGVVALSQVRYLSIQCSTFTGLRLVFEVLLSAAPAPDVQEQPQHHLSSSCRPSRSFMEFTYKGARAAVRGRASGARRLVEWRMRRACSPFEAWGALHRSRFAELASNCLKGFQTTTRSGTKTGFTCFVWQVAKIHEAP